MTARFAGKTYARLWLIVLGAVLVVLGLVGLVLPHPFGASVVHLEGVEMVVHLVLGAALLAAGWWIKADAAVATVSVEAAVLFAVVALAGFAAGSIGPWHVGTLDNVLHLLVAGVSGAAWWVSREPAMEMAGRPVM